MDYEKIILGLIFLIVFLNLLAETIFEGFSLKSFGLFLAVAALITLLWFRPKNRRR
ncbi:hypothetical protein [Mesobacillus harenae]|uniref:hypothetical protein n=1 Tax=Mesobacillus harenae TaxID=2213203 RepID=UPI001580DB15|nr:hypothetical protein [Mesobacillus harenae]